MSAALTIAAVELRRFLRDRTALLFVLVLPVAVIVVIGSAFGAAPTSLPIGLVVLDDAGPTGQEVRAALEDADTLEVRAHDARADLDVAIRTGAVAGGVVVTEGAVTTVLDLADSDSAAVRSTVGGVLARLGIREAVAETLVVDPALVEQVAGALPPVAVTRIEVDEGLGDASSAFAYTAPSNLVLFVFINSVAVGGVFVATRRLGITQRWAAAPVSTGSIVGGVLLSRLGFAVAQALIIVVLGAALFGVGWGDPIGVAAVVLVFSVIATAVGVLAGILARTEDQTTAVGIPLSIGLGMLGGCMWPLELVGPTMRTIGHLTPHAWAMDAFVVLVFDGGGVTDIVTEVAVLIGFAAVLLGTATALLRRHLV